MQKHLALAIESKIASMKIGFQGRFYPVPKEIEQEHIAEWQLKRSIELGCTVLQASPLPSNRDNLTAFGRLAESSGMELEISVGGAFQLAGANADKEAKARFVQAIENAKLLGMPVIRSGYGRLNVETSRFNREIGIQDHIRRLLPSLKEAAAIARDADVRFAVENHCDFTGRELAQLLELVDSPYVGAALDTGNGYTVFSDPMDDLEALAPYTFTTHMKDMRIVPNPLQGGIPLTAVGCVLGEGNVDLSAAIDLLAQQSPCAEGLHLIIEPGWMEVGPDADESSRQTEYFQQSVHYLKQLQTLKGGGKQHA